MRDLRARLALIAVALTMVGKIFMSTMAPSNSGPKNGTYRQKDKVEQALKQQNNHYCAIFIVNKEPTAFGILTKK